MQLPAPRTSRQWVTALCATLGLAACNDATVTDVPLATRPSASVVVPAPVQKQAQVCADGPAGTYTFTISEVSDPNNIGTILVSSPFTLDAGQCTVVARSSQASYFVTVTVQVASTGAPLNVALDSIVKTQWVYSGSLDTTPDGTVTSSAGPSASFELGIERAADLVFVFSADAPSLSLTKTADAASVSAGSNIGFSLLLSSNGPGTATGVTLTDTLPTGTGISWSMSPSVQGCSIVNNVLSCSFGDLANGDTRTVHVTSTTMNGSCGTYPNRGHAAATNHGDVQSSATTSVTGCETVCTATQGGWGQDAKGNNIGKLRDTYFGTVFPTGMTVGGAKNMTFTSAAAVNAYLPAGGTPGVLTNNYTNPTKTESNVFGGQVTALKLNVAFSNAGVGGWQPGLSSAIVTVGPSAIVGMTVTQVLALAESVLGGGALPSGVTVSGLNAVVTSINEMSSPDGCSFGNGTVI